MKYSIAALLLLFVASCSSPETEESIRAQIAGHKKEISSLNLEIAELEKKLNGLNHGSNDNSQQIPVTITEVTAGKFNHYIQVSGTAEAVKDAFISPEVSGQIREIYVQEGDYVERGQLLAKLNTEISESTIADLKSSLELATVVFEKQERLWKQGIGSEIEYLNAKNSMESLNQKLKSAQAQYDMAMLKSPVSGVVDDIMLKRGELALPGQQVMQIVNLEELYINADVSESYLAQVKEGDIVRLEFPVFPDLKMEAPIFRKGNVINPNNRTFNIQLKLKNPDRSLKPNILSVVHINDFSADSALVIPSVLIKQDITGSYIYTLQEQDGKLTAKKIYVTTGKSYLDKTMVVSGLQEGQKIIVQGFNMVSDGSEVSVKTNDAS
jgi:membrane fusion protein, multidrug efflux system